LSQRIQTRDTLLLQPFTKPIDHQGASIRTLLWPQLDVEDEWLLEGKSFVAQSRSGAVVRSPVREILNCVQQLCAGNSAVPSECRKSRLELRDPLVAGEGQNHGAIFLADHVDARNRTEIWNGLTRPENDLQ
jgi:hypothetical protein